MGFQGISLLLDDKLPGSEQVLLIEQIEDAVYGVLFFGIRNIPRHQIAIHSILHLPIGSPGI